MRPPSARMFYDTVTVKPLVTSQDASGARAKTWPETSWVNMKASVQPSSTMRRQPYQGATRSEVDATVYFPSDPGVKPDDQLAWHVTATFDRTFSARGPANPPAGQDAVWSLELVEVK